ncbi:MAG: circularly permuted type 2 ATP-grasp protein [Rivihabitans pingtungensis]
MANAGTCSDSTLGVPGLLQAVRAGKVLVANALGSSFLESPGLHAFLPGVSQALLGEPLQLPSLLSRWCGEDAALVEALECLPQRVIKPTYLAASPREHMEPVLASQLDAASLHAWRERILRQPGDFTLQENVPLSQAPIWRHG